MFYMVSGCGAFSEKIGIFLGVYRQESRTFLSLKSDFPQSKITVIIKPCKSDSYRMGTRQYECFEFYLQYILLLT